MITRQITVTNDTGLHARPASVFVQTAKIFSSEITIRNVTTGSNPADAKSIMSVLILGVEKNHLVEISVKGGDEDKAVEELVKVVQTFHQ
jgi:phosphocarrier protein HPr